MIESSGSQVAPRSCNSRPSVNGDPPSMPITFSAFSRLTQKPRRFPSGAKNGSSPFSVPGIGVASAAPRSRMYSCRMPAFTLAYTARRPSGEMVNERIGSMKSTNGICSESKTRTGAALPVAFLRVHSKTASAAKTTAMTTLATATRTLIPNGARFPPDVCVASRLAIANARSAADCLRSSAFLAKHRPTMRSSDAGAIGCSEAIGVDAAP